MNNAHPLGTRNTVFNRWGRQLNRPTQVTKQKSAVTQTCRIVLRELLFPNSAEVEEGDAPRLFFFHGGVMTIVLFLYQLTNVFFLGGQCTAKSGQYT